ncbi:hypothetical protein AOLI_G00317490 [Acnodon oligacanthus]
MLADVLAGSGQKRLVARLLMQREQNKPRAAHEPALTRRGKTALTVTASPAVRLVQLSAAPQSASHVRAEQKTGLSGRFSVRVAAALRLKSRPTQLQPARGSTAEPCQGQHAFINQREALRYLHWLLLTNQSPQMSTASKTNLT